MNAPEQGGAGEKRKIKNTSDLRVFTGGPPSGPLAAHWRPSKFYWRPHRRPTVSTRTHAPFRRPLFGTLGLRSRRPMAAPLAAQWPSTAWAHLSPSGFCHCGFRLRILVSLLLPVALCHLVSLLLPVALCHCGFGFFSSPFKNSLRRLALTYAAQASTSQTVATVNGTMEPRPGS